MFQVPQDNPVVMLCAEGVGHEQRGMPEQATRLYRLAWERSADDFERCIAAHYLARSERRPENRLRWNAIALSSALAVADERVEGFYTSLYLNVGRSHEELEHWSEASQSYAQAQNALQTVPEGPYRDTLAGAVTRALQRISSR